jgi:hypothetical protein
MNKKIALSILLLSGLVNSDFAFADASACDTMNAAKICKTTAWEFGVEGLYLKPIYSGSQYDYNYLGYKMMGDTANFVKKDQDWSGAFKLEGAYHFDATSDLNLNWTHYGHQTKTLSNAYTSLASGEKLVFDYEKVDLRWDAVNFEFGQHLKVSTLKDARIHVGLQYANIKRHDFAPLSVDGVPTNNDTTNKFAGLGPRIGVDLIYGLTKKIAVYGKFASALLVGKSEVNDLTGAGIIPSYRASTLKVVPEIEGKLGVNYTHNTAQGNLVFDVGYTIANYFSVFEKPQNIRPSSNIAFQGPSVGVKWMGDFL